MFNIGLIFVHFWRKFIINLLGTILISTSEVLKLFDTHKFSHFDEPAWRIDHFARPDHEDSSLFPSLTSPLHQFTRIATLFRPVTGQTPLIGTFNHLAELILGMWTKFRVIVRVISFAKWWVRRRISGLKKRGRSGEAKHSRSEGMRKWCVEVMDVRWGDEIYNKF